MKIVFINIFVIVLLTTACSTMPDKKNIPVNNNKVTYQTVAVFKSAEQTGFDEYKLVFRKLDDCQYILFHADIKTIETTSMLFKGTEGEFTANNDFINFRYKIDYIQESIPDPYSGEKIIINRLTAINRAVSDRFSEAGILNDLQVYDFVIDLKHSVLMDSSDKISQMVNYPLYTVIKKKRIKINKPEEFIKYYHSIITQKIRTAVLNERLADIRSTPKGLIIGSGEVQIKLIDDRILIASFKSY